MDNESEDIDADDQDINDGPVKDELDLVTYQQEFLNNGKSVKALNKVAVYEKQRQMDHDIDEGEDDSSNYVQPIKTP
jgi:hypothetical protein